jgi:hypothetical protein
MSLQYLPSVRKHKLRSIFLLVRLDIDVTPCGLHCRSCGAAFLASSDLVLNIGCGFASLSALWIKVCSMLTALWARWAKGPNASRLWRRDTGPLTHPLPQSSEGRSLSQAPHLPQQNVSGPLLFLRAFSSLALKTDAIKNVKIINTINITTASIINLQSHPA